MWKNINLLEYVLMIWRTKIRTEELEIKDANYLFTLSLKFKIVFLSSKIHLFCTPLWVWWDFLHCTWELIRYTSHSAVAVCFSSEVAFVIDFSTSELNAREELPLWINSWTDFTVLTLELIYCVNGLLVCTFEKTHSLCLEILSRFLCPK